MHVGTNVNSTSEPVTKVLELNPKLITALRWWKSVLNKEPSFTSHTLQEGKCMHMRYYSIITARYAFSLSDITTTPGKPEELDHVKQYYHTHSLNSSASSTAITPVLFRVSMGVSGWGVICTLCRFLHILASQQSCAQPSTLPAVECGWLGKTRSPSPDATTLTLPYGSMTVPSSKHK